MAAMTFNQGQVIEPEQSHRSMLAKLLIEQSQAPYSGPVVAPSQNLARVLSAIGGNLLLAKEAQQQKLNQAQDLGTMQQALNANKTAWVNPDVGRETIPGGFGAAEAGATPAEVAATDRVRAGATILPPGASVPTGSPGGVSAMASVLAGNPRLAPQAIQLQFQAIANEQAQKQAMATKLLEHGLTVGPGGRIVPMPGYGESRGSIEGLVAGATEAGKNKPLLERKEGEAQIDLRFKPQIAAETARQENPYLIGRGTAIHAGNVATDVRAAPALAQGRTAGELAAVLSGVPAGTPGALPGETAGGARARLAAQGTETGNLTARTQPGPGGKPLGQVVAQQTAQGSGTGANTAALTPVETPQGVMPAAAALSAAHSAGAAQGGLQLGPDGKPLAQGVAQATATGAGQGQTAAALTPTVNTYGEPGSVAPAAQVQAQARGAGEQAAQGPQQTRQGEVELRKEFEAQPQVKTFREVLPVYNSMVDAAPRDTKASDLNIIYGLAKIMDPTSVVREGEYAMAAAAGSPAERLKGLFSEVSGGARLTPQQRADFLREAESRMGAYRQVHDQLGAQYEMLAGNRGLIPGNVVTRVEPTSGVPTPTAKPTAPIAAGPTATDAQGNKVMWNGAAWVPQ